MHNGKYNAEYSELQIFIRRIYGLTIHSTIYNLQILLQKKKENRQKRHEIAHRIMQKCCLLVINIENTLFKGFSGAPLSLSISHSLQCVRTRSRLCYSFFVQTVIRWPICLSDCACECVFFFWKFVSDDDSRARCSFKSHTDVPTHTHTVSLSQQNDARTQTNKQKNSLHEILKRIVYTYTRQTTEPKCQQKNSGNGGLSPSKTDDDYSLFVHIENIRINFGERSSSQTHTHTLTEQNRTDVNVSVGFFGGRRIANWLWLADFVLSLFEDFFFPEYFNCNSLRIHLAPFGSGHFFYTLNKPTLTHEMSAE